MDPGTYCAVVFDEHNEVFVEPVYFEVRGNCSDAYPYSNTYANFASYSYSGS